MLKPTEIIRPPLTADNYYDDDRVSQSKLKAYLQCPNYYKWRYVDKKDEELSDALLFGKAVDCLVTTPDRFNGLFEASKRRSDGNFIDGKYLLTETNYDKAIATAAKIKKQPVMEMFNWMDKQVPLYDDKRKALLDFFGIDKRKTGWIVDLKTCADLDKFKNSMHAYQYYFQMAFYRLLAKQLHPEVKRWECYIIAIDKTPQKKFGVFRIDQRKFRYEETLIRVATDGINLNVRIKPGLCTVCPEEINCQYALFDGRYIETI